MGKRFPLERAGNLKIGEGLMKVFTIAAVLLALITLVSLRALDEPQTSYQDLKREAERHFEHGSFALAYSLYSKIDKKQLPSIEARWVDFVR